MQSAELGKKRMLRNRQNVLQTFYYAKQSLIFPSIHIPKKQRKGIIYENYSS